MAHWEGDDDDDPCRCCFPGDDDGTTAATQSTVSPCLPDTQDATFHRSCPSMRTLSRACAPGTGLHAEGGEVDDVSRADSTASP